MPVMTVRRGIWTAALVALLVGAAVVLLPMVASTRVVRDRIAQELTSLTGHRVLVEQGPSMSFWPTVTASLDGFTLARWDPAATPVLKADRVEIELSAWPALAGDIVFSRIRLIRPTLRLAHARGSGRPIADDGAGTIGYAIDAARAAVATNPAEPETDNLPADPFGTVEFVDGRVVEVGPDGENEVATSVSGRLEWTALNQPAILALDGIWRGEPVSVAATAVEPLILLGGGPSELSVEIEASPLAARFEGRANLSGEVFLDGALSLASPSVRRLLEWTKSPFLTGLPPGAVSLASQVSGTLSRLRFADAEIILSERRGVGALEVSLLPGPPAVSGTLAFGDLDLGEFLSAFTPLRAEGGPGRTEIGPGRSAGLNLDIRLSATQASWGAVRFANLAATAQVRHGLAVLDMTDASAFGGTVQASLRIDYAPEAASTEVRMHAENVDAAALAAAGGFEGAIPEGRGSLSLMLKGAGTDWTSVLGTAGGSFTARLGPGRFVGIDLGAFVAKLGEGRFFELEEVADGSFAVENVDVKANIVDGAARIERAAATLADREITIVGIVPLLGRGLALSGRLAPRVAPAEGQPPPEPIASFFVGGSWENPIVSPLTSFWGGR